MEILTNLGFSLFQEKDELKFIRDDLVLIFDLYTKRFCSTSIITDEQLLNVISTLCCELEMK